MIRQRWQRFNYPRQRLIPISAEPEFLRDAGAKLGSISCSG